MVSIVDSLCVVNLLLLSPIYSVPNSFMKIVCHACVNVADEHKRKCNFNSPSKQIGCSKVQYENQNSLSNCFDY